MPQRKSHLTLKPNLHRLTMLTLILAAQAQAAILSMKYDEGNPWQKVSSDDNEMMTFLYGTIADVDFQRVATAYRENTIDIHSYQLATSMFYQANDKAQKIPLAALTRKKREALYQNVHEYDAKSKFISDFAWCAHAKLPQACHNAASAITGHSKVDGSKNIATGARDLLFHRAKVLERNSQKHRVKDDQRKLKTVKKHFAHSGR